MAKELKKRTHTFEVDGETYTLKYDFNAICDIEIMGGMGIPALIGGNMVGFNTIRLIIWGGLKWKMNGLTMQGAGLLIRKYVEGKGDLTTLFNDATALLTDSMGLETKVSTEEDVEDLGNARTGE